MDQTVSPVTELAPNVSCSRCGTPFVCGYTAGAAQCWCMHAEGEALPLPAADTVGCLCPTCLHLVQAQRGDGFLEA
ncbi:MAG TPA: cysteine-rich CWC family protein [Rhodocyclaceae bacterium]|nr:cysteine-rich CWC family protein [Rhodocyclaceae bacterium]